MVSKFRVIIIARIKNKITKLLIISRNKEERPVSEMLQRLSNACREREDRLMLDTQLKLGCKECFSIGRCTRYNMLFKTAWNGSI